MGQPLSMYKVAQVSQHEFHHDQEGHEFHHDQERQVSKEFTIEMMMEIMQHFACPQNPVELAKMVEVVRGKTSLLEIGSSYGGSISRLGEVLAPGATIVSVDYPFDKTPIEHFVSRQNTLHNKLGILQNCGYAVSLIEGNSHSKSTVDMVKGFGPFDFGFIDGDHSYEGVKQDWEDYGPMCKIVGFHDIATVTEKFWKELKAEGKYRTEEFIDMRKTSFWTPNFGIGIVYRE